MLLRKFMYLKLKVCRLEKRLYFVLIGFAPDDFSNLKRRGTTDYIIAMTNFAPNVHHPYFDFV